MENTNPLKDVLNIISGKWKVQISWQIALSKNIRFNQLKLKI